MILAAGLGTRLRPLTLELPKPLVWVGDEPALLHIAKRLVNAGISNIVMNTFHHAEAFLEGQFSKEMPLISIIREKEILGTGGGVANAAPWLGEGEVLVWNGDILAPLLVQDFLKAHERAGASGAIQAAIAYFAPIGATLAMASRPLGQGTVGLDEHGYVVRLRGERFGEEKHGGDFLGISVLSNEFRRTLPMPGCLVGDGFLPWLRNGGKIASYEVKSRWEDIGSIESYWRANMAWLNETGKSRFIGDGVRIDPTIEVIESVVGAGAIVRGAGSVYRSILWPGAQAVAPITNSIVMTDGTVVPIPALIREKTSPP